MPNAAHDDDDAEHRFLADLGALAGEQAVAGDRFGIAVSGGPDSMALLALAAAALPGRIEAASVDHGLRAQAAEEAAMVARWCAAHAIPHATLAPETPIAGSVQAAARAVRYRLLEAWRQSRGLDWLLTAHHADDQAETLLMRLNRGSGVGGLAGVRARNGQVLRPLLGWRRAELAQQVARRNLPHVHDPSNDDPRFDRAAMRAHLADAEWIDAAALARSAAALAQAQEALEWSAAELAREHVCREDGRIVLHRTDLPPELLRRLLLHMLALAAPDSPAPRGSTLDQAIVQLLQGRRAMIGDMLLEGGSRWEIRAAPPRKAR